MARKGTTGLRIFQRLQGRDDLEILQLPDALRKDLHAREDAINASDVTLPVLTG